MARNSNPNVEGASDLYNLMLEVKNGIEGGGTRGFTHISKTQCITLGIEWSFVESSATILGLTITRHARLGYVIEKAKAEYLGQDDAGFSRYRLPFAL